MQHSFYITTEHIVAAKPRDLEYDAIKFAMQDAYENVRTTPGLIIIDFTEPLPKRIYLRALPELRDWMTKFEAGKYVPPGTLTLDFKAERADFTPNPDDIQFLDNHDVVTLNREKLICLVERAIRKYTHARLQDGTSCDNTHWIDKKDLPTARELVEEFLQNELA